MPRITAEKYRDIDFSHAKRGPVVPTDWGKTKISIRIDNAVLDYFRGVVEKAGGGNYQSLINDALVAQIQQRSVLTAIRQVVREELAQTEVGRRLTTRSNGRSTKRRAA